MQTECNYEPLDFSSIMGEKFAVHCQTEEDAQHFCAEIKRQFGKKFHKEGTTHWDMYGDLTAYSPYLNWKGPGMTYSDARTMLKKGLLWFRSTVSKLYLSLVRSRRENLISAPCSGDKTIIWR